IDQQKDIEAVVIATPDHSHAPASAVAIRADKHVYVEKPMTRTVQESRVLRELARKRRVATSMGNQGTAGAQFRRAIEIIRGGVLGTIEEVHAWNDQGGRGYTEAPEGEKKIPPYLDWNLWLGPAAMRPFHPRWMAWHAWRDFGTANLGNWASHTMNLAFKALKVDSLWDADPATKPRIRVEADTDAVYRLSFPKWEYVRWHIPARGDLPPIVFHWHNGSCRPGMKQELARLLGRELHMGPDQWDDWARLLLIGTEGKLLANAHNVQVELLPAEKFRGVQAKTPETLDRSRGHERDWLEACRGGAPAWARFAYAGPLTEFNMLGNVATQFNAPLEYDPLEGSITNHPEAHKALHDEYREGWTL
ncbi:MAG: Gfo/Idh/MocA family protein, partial [Planctomycetota bacterium]